MKNKKIIQQVGVGAMGALMFLSPVAIAFAQNEAADSVASKQPTSTQTEARSAYMRKVQEKRDAASTKINEKNKLNQSGLVTKSNKEIENRIKDLNEMSDRIGEMKNMTEAQRASLTSSLQSQVTNLNALKEKIGADTDMASLKADAKSISSDNRIYMLEIPKAKILAGADRSMTVVNMLNEMASKLQTRISDAQAAGKDVTKLNSALNDLNAKLADAKSLSDSITSTIPTLAPDQGNKTIIASNKTALDSARKNLSMIEKDLKAARADISMITKGVKGIGQSATSTTMENGNLPSSSNTLPVKSEQAPVPAANQ